MVMMIIMYVKKEAMCNALIVVPRYWVDDRQTGVQLKSGTKIFLSRTVSGLVLDTNEHPIQSTPTSHFPNTYPNYVGRIRKNKAAPLPYIYIYIYYFV